MTEIEQTECNRIYCRHGISHSLDVARIAYIIVLEKGLDISKDLIYATAILHDIGRCQSNKDHNVYSVELAEKILNQCNYSKDDITLILDAVYSHRNLCENLQTLSDIIKYADKISRNCFNCKAYDTCYWDEDRKNKKLIY